MRSFQALDRLEDREYSGGLNAEAFYDLVLAATGDQDQASRLAADRAQARQRANLTP